MDRGTKWFRQWLLSMAESRRLGHFAEKHGMRFGARRFVAGTTAEEALAQVRRLHKLGIATILDILGESVKEPSEAEAFRDAYIQLLGALAEARLDSDLSLKPTQLGLALDPETAYRHIYRIMEEAQAARIADAPPLQNVPETKNAVGRFLCIDMENSPYTDATIQLVQRLHAAGLTRVGTVIQAYLHRSYSDVVQLTKQQIQLRLVKGAYKEPAAISYPAMTEVNSSFKRLIRYRLESGVYTAIATHDEHIVKWTRNTAARLGVKADRFEFQMLYGIREGLQQTLALEGYPVRCYVPFGASWYPYFMRRLAERPANVWFVVKNILKS